MMEPNMIATGIQIIGSKINDLEIENSIKDLDLSAPKSFALNIKKMDIQKNASPLMATVEMVILIEINQNGGQLFRLNMSLEGSFMSDKQTNEDDFKELVAISGVSALIGIARGKIETISASVLNSGKIVIPFVNVIEYYKAVKMNKRSV